MPPTPRAHLGGRVALDLTSGDRSAHCRHHRRDLDLHLRAVLDQPGHLHRGHGDGGITCPIGLPGIEGKEPGVIAVAAVVQLLALRPLGKDHHQVK